jgi:hypothetical protein
MESVNKKCLNQSSRSQKRSATPRKERAHARDPTTTEIAPFVDGEDVALALALALVAPSVAIGAALALLTLPPARDASVGDRGSVIGGVEVPAGTHHIGNALRRPSVLRNQRVGVDEDLDGLGAQLVLEDVQARKLGAVVQLGKNRSGTGEGLAPADIPVIRIVVPDDGLETEDFLTVIMKVNQNFTWPR